MMMMMMMIKIIINLYLSELCFDLFMSLTAQDPSTQFQYVCVIYTFFMVYFSKPQSSAVISYEFPIISCVFLQNSVHSVLSFQSRQCFANIPAEITLFSSFQTTILFQRYNTITLFFDWFCISCFFPLCSYSYSSLCWTDSGLTAVSVMISITESSFKLPSHFKFSYFTSSSSTKFLTKTVYL
jgi:hypothetical protein